MVKRALLLAALLLTIVPARADFFDTNAPGSSSGGSGCVPASTAGKILSDNGTGGCTSNTTGTGILTALGFNVGNAGAPVVLNGAGGTPSSLDLLHATDLPNASVNAITLGTGTSVSLAAPRQYYVCTSTCTVTPPVPAAGYEFCVMNDDNVATVITMAAIGSSARYENTARTAYGTAGTGTFVSGGAVGDKVCIVGRDSTHYLTTSFNGTWTAN